MKKLILLLFLIPSATYSQQYFRFHTDLLDLDNRTLVQESELLSVILVDGYLDGDLKAYKFDVRSEDVKWKPIPENMVPDEWDPKLDYYQFDRIAYQGKYYELQVDFIAAGTVPTSFEYWWLLDLHGDVVSTIHSFPEASDSTTKAYLLENLAEYSEYYGDEWYEDIEYWMNDIVLYKGQYYECKGDRIIRKQPDVEPEYWLHVAERVRFYLPRDLTRISILYARDDRASLVPQVLKLSYESMSTEHWQSPGLSFYYQDVVDYLVRQRQLPLLYSSQVGYIGAPQLVPGYNNIAKVVELVQESLKTGSLKPSTKDIADAALFDLFVKSKPDDPQAWWVTQDLITNDVWVSSLQASNDGAYRPFLRVPWKLMEGMVKAKEPVSRLWNYSEALEGGAFKTSVDTLEIDTLAARSYSPVAGPASSRMYFIEGRTAPAQTNPELSQAMKNLWPLLQQAIKAGTIQLQSSQTRVFACDRPFPEITIDREKRDWVIEKGFTLNPENDPVIDSASVSNPVSGIGVQYKRYVTSKKSKAPLFEPVKLFVRFFRPDAGFNYECYFMWEDVVKLTAGRSDLKGLMDAVRSGKLKFDYSELVYGLVGEK